MKKLVALGMIAALPAMNLSALAETQGNGVENENGNGEEEGDEVEGKASANVIGEKDGVKFVRNEYKASKKGGVTPLQGWGFATPRFESAGQFIEHFDKLIKEQGKTDVTGEKLLLDLAHTTLEAKARIRVKANEPQFKKDEDAITHYENKAKQHPDRLLFGIEDAYNWIPGVRELSQKKQFELGMENVMALIKEKGATHPEVLEAMAALATKMPQK